MGNKLTEVLDRILTNLVITMVEQREHITEHSSDISAVILQITCLMLFITER